MKTNSNVKIADLVAWEVDKDTPTEMAIVIGLQALNATDAQNEKYAKVIWNTGDISNVPLKLVYLVNRSQK
jgi:hypothetical protein